MKTISDFHFGNNHHIGNVTEMVIIHRAPGIATLSPGEGPPLIGAAFILQERSDAPSA